MKSHRLLGQLATGAGLMAALAALSLGIASATPVMDGEKDAEYTLVGSSPKDNLSAADTADPRLKALDVTGFWAANTGTDLYLYIELPYYDPSVIEGEWAVTFHFKGANDAIGRTDAAAQDPFGAFAYYHYGETAGQPGPNAVLKSNMLGFLRDYDGNQGWAAIVFANNTQNGWAWPGASQMIFTNSSVDVQQANNLLHGYGSAGGEIVYKGAKGIEVKIPLALFGVAGGDSGVVPPVPGDQVLMQFYDNFRDRPKPNYPRGAEDGAPFEDGIQADQYLSNLTKWGSYTLTIPPVMEVGSVGLKNAWTSNVIVVSFSDDVGTGGTTPANYTVTNVATGAAVPVSAVTIDPNNPKKVQLTVQIPYNVKVHVAVANVQSTTGKILSTTKNAGDLGPFSAIQFNLYDPYGAIAALGTNPDTGQPYKLGVTGDPTGWSWDQTGNNEIPLNKVGDTPLHYQSPVVLTKAGVFGFKYRIPELPQAGDYDNWNGLNPRDRRGFAPASSEVYQITDNAAGRIFGVNYVGNVGDAPVKATFKLIDKANISQGRPVYITGKFTADTAFTDNNQWNADPTVAFPMTAVAGQTGVYTATIDLHPGYGFDTTTEYKYIIKPDPTNDPGNTLWDDLNKIDGVSKNRFVEFHRLPDGTPAPVVDVVLSDPRPVRILRSVAGLDPVPQWGDYYTDQDANLDGNVTVLDALKAVHP